MDDVG
jgi:phospholipase D1/2